MTEKKCSKCQEIKPFSEFYRRSDSADGYQYWCKPCRSSDGKENRQRYNFYDRVDYHKNRQAGIARTQLNRAVASGEVESQPCTACGNQKAEAHHPDYWKPLEVVWLCSKCHHGLHHPS